MRIASEIAKSWTNVALHGVIGLRGRTKSLGKFEVELESVMSLKHRSSLQCLKWIFDHQ
jgi:hypothetical protein